MSNFTRIVKLQVKFWKFYVGKMSFWGKLDIYFLANTDIYREYQTHKCRGMRSAFENLREKRVNFWRYWLLFILFVHLQDKKCQYLTFCKTGPSNSETWMLSPVARSLLLKARPTAGPVCCSIRMDTSSRLGVDFHWARSFVRRSIIRPDIWP